MRWRSRGFTVYINQCTDQLLFRWCEAALGALILVYPTKATDPCQWFPLLKDNRRAASRCNPTADIIHPIIDLFISYSKIKSAIKLQKATCCRRFQGFIWYKEILLRLWSSVLVIRWTEIRRNLSNEMNTGQEYYRQMYDEIVMPMELADVRYEAAIKYAEKQRKVTVKTNPLSD